MAQDYCITKQLKTKNIPSLNAWSITNCWNLAPPKICSRGCSVG